MLKTWLKTPALWGIIATLAVGIPALFLTWQSLQDRNFQFKIAHSSDVVTVDSPPDKLVILYEDKDILEENLNLRVMTVIARNTGNSNILQNEYDIEREWGFEVTNGDIVEATVIRSSNEYLLDEFKELPVSDRKLVFPKPIFEAGEAVEFRITVLHSSDLTPHITPFGKIAGIGDFDLVDSTSQPDEMLEALKHKWALPMLLGYAGILVFFAMFFAVILIVERIRKKRRQRIILQVQEDFTEITSEQEKVLQLFQKNRLDIDLLQACIDGDTIIDLREHTTAAFKKAYSSLWYRSLPLPTTFEVYNLIKNVARRIPECLYETENGKVQLKPESKIVAARLLHLLNDSGE